MDKKQTEMMNNNLDFEKNSNTTTGMNLTAGKAVTNSTTNALTATVSNNSGSGVGSGSGSGSGSTGTNDNSYFNRFDNRIAANLAAVLNGSRFRSTSTSSVSSSASSSGGRPSRANANVSGSHSKHFGGRKGGGGAELRTTTPTSTPTPACPKPTRFQLNGSGTLRRAESPMSMPMSGGGNGSGPGSMGRCRPLHLFTQANLNCNDNEKGSAPTPSSDEDNSPTELNNCKRLTDKPPLVKRLTMGLLRSHEESRPLVNGRDAPAVTNAAATLQVHNAISANQNQIYSNGYINEEAFEPEKYIASKFGDSCRQSLTAIPMLDTLNLNDNSEFNLKKRYLRETSSANSSPKIFANRLRMNATGSRYSTTAHSATNTHALFADEDEDDLKEASWFQAGISRDIAVEVLSNKSPGAFLVRKSTSKPGCYALTLRVPSPPGPKIANYIILRTARGYKIKGFRKEFSSLKALITHHSVMPELLPVPLAMPRPTNMTSSRRNLDDFDTYDSLQMLLKYLRAKNMENE